MNDLNTVCLMGRLTQSVECRYLKSGTPIMEMTVAVNRNVKKGEQWEQEGSFFTVKTFSKYAESLAKKNLLLKGARVILKGSMVQERWEKDGQKKSRVVVMADEFNLVDFKKDEQTPYVVDQSQTPFTKGQDTGFYTQSEDIPFSDDVVF